MNNKAMFKISYGLYVLTAKRGDKDNGCIINTAVQVASEPNTISIAVNKANFTHDLVKETGRFNISMISQEADFELFKRFGFQSGRDVDKFAGFEDSIERAANGLYVVKKGTNAFISAEVLQTIDLGSHTLFISSPVDMDVLADVPSCTYDFYQSSIKPKPQPAPEVPKGETVWRCRICGYEHVGEELPADFICPICKHPASDFEKIIR
jgi:flavin reductase (DIM6/NTAB) family NADH-FMN oxidoreductase RutF